MNEITVIILTPIAVSIVLVGWLCIFGSWHPTRKRLFTILLFILSLLSVGVTIVYIKFPEYKLYIEAFLAGTAFFGLFYRSVKKISRV